MMRVIIPDDYERSVLSIFDGFKVKNAPLARHPAGIEFIRRLAVGLGLWFIGVRYALDSGNSCCHLRGGADNRPIMIGLIAFVIAIADSTALGMYIPLHSSSSSSNSRTTYLSDNNGQEYAGASGNRASLLLAGGQIAGVSWE